MFEFIDPYNVRIDFRVILESKLPHLWSGGGNGAPDVLNALLAEVDGAHDVHDGAVRAA